MNNQQPDSQQSSDHRSEDANNNEESETGSAGRTVWEALKMLPLLPVLLLTPLLGAIPPAWRLYHKLHLWSGYKMQKTANAHAIANVRRSNGKEDVLPAAWIEASETDKDQSGWAVKGLGDKRYDAAVHGANTARIGKADIIHLNEDSTEQGTWAEATIDNAFQLDRERYLFRDASVSITQFIYDEPSEQVVADGGQAQPQQFRDEMDVSLERPGILEDVLVPTSSRTGYDGQVVSWMQYSNMKTQQSDQEKIREAKNAAWTAAKFDDMHRTDLIKWALILGAAGFVLLFHQDIGAFIAGLTNGGGGGGGVGSAVSGGLGMIKAPFTGVV